MQVAGLLLLAAAQALWAKPSDDDHHGVHVPELNTDVDYRDFNETVDLATEASKTSSIVQNLVVTSIRNAIPGKNGSIDNTVFIRNEHEVFPLSNITYELRKDCRNVDCSANSWFAEENTNELIMLLSLIASSLVCLTVLIALKLKLLLMRSWGYSPSLMDGQRNEIRMYRVNTPNTDDNTTRLFFQHLV